jgi:hypothetical protein
MQNHAQNNIDKYFAGSDIDDLCADFMDEDNDSRNGFFFFTTDADRMEACKEHYEEETADAIEEMAQQASKLAKLENGKYAQQAAKLGQYIWKNQFVFKAVSKKMQACGSSMNLEIGGQKITHIEGENITTLNETECN